MEYIEAPNFYFAELDRSKSLFLAGSITNAPDWQAEILELCPHLRDFNIFNPRRKHFDITIKDNERMQIVWEHTAIHFCDHILFWFAKETLAPIALYELGSALYTHRNISIGVHPEYARRNDVFYQVNLDRYRKPIFNNLKDLGDSVKIGMGRHLDDICAPCPWCHTFGKLEDIRGQIVCGNCGASGPKSDKPWEAWQGYLKRI